MTAMRLTELSDREILAIVEPLMENCLAGSNENDHSKHVRDFTQRMQRIVTPEELSRQLAREPRAYFTERQFLSVFRRQQSVGVVWRQFTSLNTDELINQAIFVDANGRVLIDHCMIC